MEELEGGLPLAHHRHDSMELAHASTISRLLAPPSPSSLQHPENGGKVVLTHSLPPGHCNKSIDQIHASFYHLSVACPTISSSSQAYYTRFMEEHNYSGLEVKYIGKEIGKGVFATRNYDEDELVFKEHMLVGAQHSHNKADALVCSFCYCFVGSIELQIGRRIHAYMQEEADKSGSDRTDCNEKMMRDNIDLPDGLVESLISGNICLPYSNCFPLPSIVSCIGGCKEEIFCSESCAQAAWASYHSLLCTGPKSHCQNKDMLLKFINHADETNDIFLVAAKVISGTILKALSLKQKTTMCSDYMLPNKEYGELLLLQAWEPFSMGFKRLWWKSVALPTDLGSDDEPEFRNQIRELASDSLNLLKGAIFQEEYAALFSLEVYGHIIGMFELNNLDLVVASPVEDYFIFIDELPIEEKVEIDKITKPLLDALGDEYDVPCQGTAFFALQSCINHSCSPNIRAFKRDEDKDGQAVLLANKPIKIGDQITLSYIDENSEFEERKAMLKDYGFVCSCCKCLKDSTAL